MATVNLYLRKGDDHIWRVAKALAKEQQISLSELVARAVIEYLKKSNFTE